VSESVEACEHSAVNADKVGGEWATLLAIKITAAAAAVGMGMEMKIMSVLLHVHRHM
jgi:hypothetical protein